MASVESLSHAQLINSAFRQLGGSELRGLERLEARRLAELSRSMSAFGQGAALGRNIATALVTHEALRSLHTMAQLMSAACDDSPSAQRTMNGFCGAQAPLTVNRDGASNTVVGAEVIVCGRPSAGCFDPVAQNVSCTPGCESARRAQDGVSCAQPAATCGDPQAASLDAFGGVGGHFEDKLFGLMIKIVKEKQDQIEEKLKKLEEQAKAAEEGKKKKKKKGGFGAVLGIVGAVAGAFVGMPQVGYMVGSAVGGAIDKKQEEKAASKDAQKNGSQESRNIEFEKIKFEMQKLSQMQQALSNILNTMDELAKSAIRHIKA
jgi:hypothetical protein